MDGFKNSTKTQYFKGGSTHEAKGAAKVAKVMGEFKSGKLHSGSKNGPEVTSRKQATAIAMSEARKAGAKMPMKKAEGGSVEADDALMSRMTSRELAMGAAGIRAARARLAKEPASGPAKKLPPKAVPVAPKRPLIEVKKGYGPASSLSIKLKNGGPVKKADGGPATAATPAAATTPPKAAPSTMAEVRAKAAATSAHATATLQKNKDAQATRAASQQKNNDLMAANRQQAEKNAAAKAALAPRLAENTRLKEANAAAQAQRQQNQAGVDRQVAAARQRVAEVNQRQAALGQPTIPVRRAVGGRIEGSGMAADRGTAIPASREIMVTASKTPDVPPTRKVIVPVRRAAGGLAAMPKGKC
jgi:hypothetical protein